MDENVDSVFTKFNPKSYTQPKASINLVSRAEWDADMQDGDIPPLKLPATNVFFTYTGTDQCSFNSNTLPSCHSVVKDIQSESIFEHGLPDIPYNFLLGGDGCVYEGRGWRLKPEPIPDEPELNERNTLVVAYIGKKEDEIGWPGYWHTTMERLEDSICLFGIKKQYIDDYALVDYPLPPECKEPVHEIREDWEAELQTINKDWCNDRGIPVNSDYDWKKWRNCTRFHWG